MQSWEAVEALRGGAQWEEVRSLGTWPGGDSGTSALPPPVSSLSAMRGDPGSAHDMLPQESNGAR